jgi:hypothetical protein
MYAEDPKRDLLPGHREEMMKKTAKKILSCKLSRHCKVFNILLFGH